MRANQTNQIKTIMVFVILLINDDDWSIYFSHNDFILWKLQFFIFLRVAVVLCVILLFLCIFVFFFFCTYRRGDRICRERADALTKKQRPWGDCDISTAWSRENNMGMKQKCWFLSFIHRSLFFLFFVISNYISQFSLPYCQLFISSK